MAKFTKIPTNTMSTIQLNAGILADSFDPSTQTVGNILGATTGGVNFTDTPTYSDWGDDIDNCPKNTKELKHIDDREVKMSGTFVTITADLAKMLIGGADVNALDVAFLKPRDYLIAGDFEDIWWIGDYSDKNTGTSAGYIAIHMSNALNTGGFQLQTTDKAKGQFAFEFTGHYSISATETVPYEVYVIAGGAASITLNKHAATVAVGSTVKLRATTIPDGQTVTWSSDNTSEAQVSNGTVTGVAVGVVTITASMTYSAVTYTDSCIVTVIAAS